jgi:hypothetical protein
VAFAEAAGQQEKQLAIKFFFSDDAFKREVLIASVEVRASFLSHSDALRS